MEKFEQNKQLFITSTTINGIDFHYDEDSVPNSFIEKISYDLTGGDINTIHFDEDRNIFEYKGQRILIEYDQKDKFENDLEQFKNLKNSITSNYTTQIPDIKGYFNYKGKYYILGYTKYPKKGESNKHTLNGIILNPAEFKSNTLQGTKQSTNNQNFDNLTAA